MDTLNRFSNRVDDYIKYRPGYPVEVIAHLKKEGILTNSSVVADIGSGTGISTELFLKEGNRVMGVEPNREMREAAEQLLGGYKDFMSVEGTAENTTLQDGSVDLVVASQAFHWFDKQACRNEFKRILKPGGYALLMWNDRRTRSSQFLENYEDFINMFATDYKEVNHQNLGEETFDAFFGKGNYKTAAFGNFQHLNFEGLKGRILSSSYMPSKEHRDYEHMIYVLKKLFSRFQENGKVTLEYDTKIYYGKL